MTAPKPENDNTDGSPSEVTSTTSAGKVAIISLLFMGLGIVIAYALGAFNGQ